MVTVTRTVSVLVFLSLALIPASVRAQIATGAIVGRVEHVLGAPIPGASVRATNAAIGFTRTATTDGSGMYHLPALPVGTYQIRIERSGLVPLAANVVVNVGTTTTLDGTLDLPRVVDRVDVSAVAPLVSTRSPAVGGVVDLNRLENLPLNGRQFANLAALVPGVGLGLHSDVSKSTQYVPQIGGGNGRNVNYQVDGGDNNDDTVGGLLQLFPLEAVEEFKLLTEGFGAEYGRTSGGVLNVVTRSGTNTLHGSWFTLARDEALNATTETERRSGVGKQAYSRYQYGGSAGGPIRRDKVHFFGAYERTQQDTNQVVDTRSLFPAEDGVFGVPFRENLFTGKITAAITPAHYLAARVASDTSTQPSGAGPLAAHSSWTTSDSTFRSMNVNHNWVLRGSALNQVVFQYSDFSNDVPVRTPGPAIMAPSKVTGGGTLAPQVTEQTKWQYRDDFSWRMGGPGLAHGLRAGVNWIHEPRLFTSTLQGVNGVYVLLANDLAGPVQYVFQTDGHAEGNVPLDLYGLYVQDDWRVSDRLTVNLGVRWDYVRGMPLDQSRSYNFGVLQEAGRTGRFAGTILDDFGHDTTPDRDNVQPRLGAVYDLRGNGRDIVRAGWGIYTDLAYTNANALLSSYDAGGGGGIIFSVLDPGGIRKSDGTVFHVGDPLATIASQNAVDLSLPRTTGEVVSPRLQQPYSYQTNVGWEHQIGTTSSVSADYVRVEGRDLNMRVRVNTLVGGRRFLAGLPVIPNNANFRAAISKGRSQYDALILSVRRRMQKRLDLSASYTLANATSDVGTAYDEVAQNLIQDLAQPFAAVQNAPSVRTDSRHRLTVSAIVEAPWGVRVAPVFYYSSALPMQTSEGVDLNRDGNNNDITALAYRFTGIDSAGSATFEEAGACETVNCSRRAGFSQLNLRASKAFSLVGNAKIEAIVEVFNLLNARNPALPLSMARTANGKPLASFMQPVAYAGDAGQGEQRVGQVGFRITF